MKTFALIAAVVCCSSAFGQAPPVGPGDAAGAAVRAGDAPVLDEPIVFELDGKTAGHGRPTVKLAAGQAAPYPGRLFDAQEQTHREQINERNAGELADYKAPGNITLTKAQLIVIVAGVGVACAAAATGIVLGVQASQQHRPGP